MENILSRVIIGKLELIETKSINTFKDDFRYFLENICFNIKFVEDKNTKYSSSFEKVDSESFNIIIYNYKDSGLIGMPMPAEFGLIDGVMYYISITGMSFNNTDYKNITINIFKDAENV